MERNGFFRKPWKGQINIKHLLRDSALLSPDELCRWMGVVSGGLSPQFFRSYESRIHNYFIIYSKQFNSSIADVNFELASLHLSIPW